MSIIRCEKCERMVDTDLDEMIDIGNMRHLECWVCESCAEKYQDEEAYSDEGLRVERMRAEMKEKMR